LTDVVFEKPVIVYDYPKEIKAFYMRLNDDQKTVAAMDVLVPKVYQNRSVLIFSPFHSIYNLKRNA
jgi:aspartyl/asparaginyl-tRNA synthetase